MASRRARRTLPSVAGLAIVLASVLGPGGASAMTADGTLLTNAAMVTFYASRYYGVVSPLGNTWNDIYASNLYLNPRYEVSYLASANVLVSFPIVAARKVVDPPDQGAGGIVTYRLWVINSSSWASAFNVAITDILPDIMEYAGEFGTWDGGSGGVFDAFYSFTGDPFWSDLNAGAYPQDTNITMPLYLRWILSRLGPGRSAYVDFLARVD